MIIIIVINDIDDDDDDDDDDNLYNTFKKLYGTNVFLKLRNSISSIRIAAST